jgi:hypothetical protein
MRLTRRQRRAEMTSFGHGYLSPGFAGAFLVGQPKLGID